MVVELVLELRAGDTDLLGVEHDQVVAHVDVRRVVGLVLALEAMRKLRGEATECLARGIDDVPVAAHLTRLGENRVHDLIEAP